MPHFRAILEGVFESAKKKAKSKPSPPVDEPQITVEENIKRGKEAMLKVINGADSVKQAMYKARLGWIEFRKGTPGTPPPTDRQELINWWNSFDTIKEKREAPFKGGSGISHIIAKRDWEGQHILQLIGQKGKDVALNLVEALAKGKVWDKTNERIKITYKGYVAILEKDKIRSNIDMDTWLLSGFLDTHNQYDLIELQQAAPKK